MNLSPGAMQWLESLILGVIQGVTEFLPVSSDGHLTICQHAFTALTGRKQSGEENFFFDVMLHLGTLAAILVHYRRTIAVGAKGLLGSTEVPEGYRRPALIWIGLLVGVATSPLVPDKLFFMKYIEKTFEDPIYSGIGFLITAAVLMITTQLGGKDKGPGETTILDALLVGVAQAFAPLPGVSRSGLTIAAALALGFRRTWAVGFSLMIAVPAILGASAFELRKVNPATLSSDRVAQTVAAMVVAGLVGYAAILWLVRVVQSGRLWYFSVYLMILGVAVIVGFKVYGRTGDADPTPAPIGPGRPASAAPDAPRPTSRGESPLDRPDRPGERAGDPNPGLARQLVGPRSGLDLGRPLG